MTSSIHSSQSIRKRLQRWPVLLDAILESDLLAPEFEELREKVLTCGAAIRDLLHDGPTEDATEEMVVEALVVSTAELWLAEYAASTHPNEARTDLVEKSRSIWDSASAAYWHLTGIPDISVPAATPSSGAREKQLHDQLDALFSLSHFEEIRSVRQFGSRVEVAGCIALHQLRRDLQEQAIPYAVDGFVYCVEVYEVHGHDDAEFVGTRFEPDPWITRG